MTAHRRQAGDRHLQLPQGPGQPLPVPKMAKPEPLTEHDTKRRHTAIVLVSVVDRRILPALRFVSQLPETGVPSAARVGRGFRDAPTGRGLDGLGLTWLPLHIHDAATEGLAESFRHAVLQQAARSGNVTVIVPELYFYRWWHSLLHRRSARRIAQHLQSLPGVTTVIVPFTASLQSRPHGSSVRTAHDGLRHC